MNQIPFQTIDWEKIDNIEVKAEMGTSFVKTLQLDSLRIRILEYSENYLGDHWCKTGHIVQCLEGQFEMEIKKGNKFIFRKGMSFVVSDNLSEHRAFSQNGAKLFVIDGDFLNIGLDSNE